MNSQKWLSVNFFTFFFTWGVFLPYWTGWLVNGKDLSVTAAGAIMGVAMMVRAFSTLLLYPLLTKRFSLSFVMQLLGILALVAMLFYIPTNAYTVLFIVTVIFSAIYPNLLPGMESGATLLLRKDHIHYGKARAFGSLGYTIALVVVGTVSQFFGISAVLWVMVFGLLSIVCSQFLFIPVALKEKPQRMLAKEDGTSLKDLLSERGFLIVLFISILLQGAHASYYNYGYVYLDQLHVNGFTIGLILNVAIIIEILFFAIADRYFSEMKVSTMYCIAATGSSLRWIIILVFPSVAMFIVSQLFHAISFGIAHYAFIQYISRKLKPGLISTAQGMYSALAMSLSVAVLTFLGAYLYKISPQYAFAGMLVCSIPALLLTIFTKRKYQY